jgi:hypothetical protein
MTAMRMTKHVVMTAMRMTLRDDDCVDEIIGWRRLNRLVQWVR